AEDGIRVPLVTGVQTCALPIWVSVPDSLRGRWATDQVTIPVLIDDRGLVVLHEWPWFDPARMPAEGVGLTVRSLLQWRFQPARQDRKSVVEGKGVAPCGAGDER